jgi:hypothetical protein
MSIDLIYWVMSLVGILIVVAIYIDGRYFKGKGSKVYPVVGPIAYILANYAVSEVLKWMLFVTSFFQGSSDSDQAIRVHYLTLVLNYTSALLSLLILVSYFIFRKRLYASEKIAVGVSTLVKEKNLETIFWIWWGINCAVSIAQFVSYIPLLQSRGIL